jgi:hypothetical protein
MTQLGEKKKEEIWNYSLTFKSKVLAILREADRSPGGFLKGLKTCDTARFNLPGVRLMENARLTLLEILKLKIQQQIHK